MAGIQGKVVQIMGGGSCEVVTSNSIAIAFSPPAELLSRLDDQFRFTGLLEGDDAPVTVENLTRGWSVRMVIGAHDVHDLRVPVQHGGSRTPSLQRLHED